MPAIPKTARDFNTAFSSHGTAVHKVKYVSTVVANASLQGKVKKAALQTLQAEQAALLSELAGNHASLSDLHLSFARLEGIKKSPERVLLAAEHAAKAGNWRTAYEIFRQAGTPANSVKLIARLEGMRGMVRAIKVVADNGLSEQALSAALEGYDDFARQLLPKLNPVSAALEHARFHRFDAVVRLARDSGNPIKFAQKLLESQEPSAAHGAARIFEVQKDRFEAGKAYAIAAGRHGMETRSAARDALKKAVRLLKDDAESEALGLIKAGQRHAGAMLFMQIYSDARRGAAALRGHKQDELAAWLEKPFKPARKPPGNQL